MRSNKGVLILIIVLMVITSTFAIWGYIANLSGVNKVPVRENVNRDFHYENKLYFYNLLELIGTYECKTSSCDYAKGTIDDNKYSLNYYKDAKESPIKYIAKRYAFLTDGSDDIIFYDILNKQVKDTYKAVKNYEIGLDNDLYIVQDKNNKWGVLKIENVAGQVIDFKYDFIGVQNKLSENTTKLASDKFVVKSVEGWTLVNENDVIKASYFINPIYSYNDDYVITKNGNYYYINSITGNLLISDPFLYAELAGKYVGVLNQYNQFYLINPINGSTVSQNYLINSIDEVKLEETLNGIKIIIGQEEKEVVK